MAKKDYRPSISAHYPSLVITLFLFVCISVDGFNAHNNFSINNKALTTTKSIRQQLIHHTQLFMSSKNDASLQSIRAGFIGCGTIAYSIASGLANPNHSNFFSQHSLSVTSIHVTRRSESRSSQLKNSYHNVVTVCNNAEDVVKNSDIIFLCVLPQHVDEVLGELKEKGVWKEGVHTLVSLVVCTIMKSLLVM